MQAISKICNAKIANDDALYDIDILDGYISNISPSKARTENSMFSQPNQKAGLATLDAKNKIVLPGLIDAHTHIDKSFSPVTNTQGTLLGAIRSMEETKATRNIKTIRANAEKAIKLAISHGVSVLRSHIDLVIPSDLDTVSMMVELKQHYTHLIDLEFTILGSTENDDDIKLMRQALALGADMIGGAPSLTKDPRRAIKNALELAIELGKGLDLHIDEKESTELLALEILAELCKSYNFEHPTVASHCVSLAYLDSLEPLIEKLQQTNISIIALPVCNLNLMGRTHTPHSRGITPIKSLLNAGINVAVASDNVQDPFNPFGNYDPLVALNVACFAGYMSSKAELDSAINLVTHNAAQAFNTSHYGIAPGCEASLVVTNSESLYNCCIHPPERLACLKKGQLVYNKQITESWY